jgi:hypothetical protein
VVSGLDSKEAARVWLITALIRKNN